MDISDLQGTTVNYNRKKATNVTAAMFLVLSKSWKTKLSKTNAFVLCKTDNTHVVVVFKNKS